MSFTIRPAALSDTDAIMAVEKTGIAHPWTRESIEALIEEADKTALTAVSSDGAVIGYVGASFVLDEAEIGNICVLPEYRGQGVGKALFTALLDALKEHGIKEVFLEVESDNESAVALYEKAGFVKYNQRRDYYGGGRDAMLYKRSL